MENAKHDRECTDCDLATDERLNYFTGQFLAERDFRAEQEYQIGKHRQHNRYLHGYGTVCGLKIVQHPNAECQERFVILEPGLALDCCGREIVVKEKVYIDLVKLFAAQNIDLNSNIDPKEKNYLLFSLCYEECKTEFVPALYSECGCDEFGCDANRIVEGFGIKLQLLKDLPKPLHEEPDGVNLDWMTTLSLDNAFRVALDSKGERIYVLTSAEQGQILVYDTKHHCLLRAIDIKVRAADLAVSPDGKYLYIIRGKIETETEYFLEVLNVQDLSNIPAPVNKLPLSTDPLDFNNPPQVVVATDGKVYILDPKGQKITIWKTDINTGTTGTAAQYGSPISTTKPKAIAISADNRWLFFAEENSNAIKAIKVDTPPVSSPPVIPIPLTAPENPLLLAVSGDSKRLYVVAIAASEKKVRAFWIEEAPASFPEIKPSSVSPNIVIGGATDTPIAIAASPSGKWAYILLKDNSNPSSPPKGIIKVVNGDKIATDPTQALLPSVFSVVSDPQDLVLDPEGNRLYATGKGSSSPPSCGGVSIMDVKGTQCSEIIWRALDGCPECPEDNCIPLAIVEKYVENYKKQDAAITNARIENRKFRPLVPSTETLKQLVMCALEGKTGGKDGKDGDPGEGLEEGLIQIEALSWKHNAGNNSLAKIFLKNQGNEVPGIVIAFTDPVLVSNPSSPLKPPNQMDADHVFQVLVEHDPRLKELGVVCRCPIKGMIIPVKPTKFDGSRITEAEEVQGPMAEAAAFIFDSKFFSFDGNGFPYFPNNKIGGIDGIWVRLHGDFVLDNEVPTKARAIDAEFVRGELPTGDRPHGSKVGIQGGVFESWFWIGDRPNPDE
jgi:DNA-binding beta-propeller fold protein YncE